MEEIEDAVIAEDFQKEVERTYEDVVAEYKSFCTQAGETQYRIDCMKLDLDKLNEHGRKLNQEAAMIKKEIDEKASEDK